MNLPIISIVVISYNSSETIISALNSTIQSYPNIELIISDDCSKDDTITLIKEWINKNKHHFNKIILLESDKNKGITLNLNKACRKATGKWIKPLAGDDLLAEGSIYEYYNFALKMHNCDIIHSRIKKIENKVTLPDLFPTNISFYSYPAKKQFKILIKSTKVFYSPSEFFSKKILDKLDYFDERYKFIEDYPFLLKATKNNYKICLINKPLVYYRISNKSISNSNKRSNNYINRNFHNDSKLIYKELLLPEVNISNILDILDRKIQLFREEMILKMGNKNLHYSITKIFNIVNPKYYIIKIKELFWL
jgi:alpha-1,3-rhamnosyltransferase